VEVLFDETICPRLAHGSVVTIGAYDGVHRGHMAVIARVRELAAAEGRATAVVTFDRHPASVVRPESAPLLLTDLDQKLELLAATGIDYALVIRFDGERAAEPAEQFVRDDLVGCLDARVIVVGEDFHFGHQRRGNVELLRTMGQDHEFTVAPLALVGADGEPAPDGADKVSSTAIRAALRAGHLDAANAALGRSHEVRGLVERGDARARELGYATANVSVPDDICLPADGVYAAWYVDPQGHRHPTAVSLGRRPTFYDDQPFSLLEAHLLDWSGDLYDQLARVQFVARLRDQLRFESVEALRAQMGHDCDRVRALLADR
jgi:riboflavin kinase/FMN adenylyltransferase